MFFLYDMFQDGNSLSPSTLNPSVDTIKISNGIFDHLNILNILASSSGEFDTTKPEEWSNETIFNAPFNGSMEAGLLSSFANKVNHLEVQRQEVGSDEWITLQKVYRDSDTNELPVPFNLTDTYTKNNTQYKYRVVPIDNDGNQGTALQSEIISSFNGAYIADANHIYKIVYGYTIGSMQTNNIGTIYTPYGSQYPFVAFNAKTKYDSGNITAVLLAPTSMSKTSSYIDRKAQCELVLEFNQWMTNGRPKILKDFNGVFKIISVTNPVSNSYYKELGNGLASTSFDVVEVGAFTQEYLDKLGMTNKFLLNN